MSSIATGSIFPNQPDEGASSRLFRPGVRCAVSLPRPIVTLTLPAERPCARASCSSCWPGGGWIAGCSRTGLLNNERETSLDEVLAALERPVRRLRGELGRGSVGVIDLAVNSVRMTLMPTAFSNPERLQGPRESQSSGPRKKRERSVWCPRNFVLRYLVEGSSSPR